MTWLGCLTCVYRLFSVGRERRKATIIAEVEAWAKARSIRTMLNEINGHSPDHKLYLSLTSPVATVNKAYKRAMLKIHPDKHMNDWEEQIRATEMFKEVTNKLQLFRKRMG